MLGTRNHAEKASQQTIHSPVTCCILSGDVTFATGRILIGVHSVDTVTIRAVNTEPETRRTTSANLKYKDNIETKAVDSFDLRKCKWHVLFWRLTHQDKTRKAEKMRYLLRHSRMYHLLFADAEKTRKIMVAGNLTTKIKLRNVQSLGLKRMIDYSRGSEQWNCGDNFYGFPHVRLQGRVCTWNFWSHKSCIFRNFAAEFNNHVSTQRMWLSDFKFKKNTYSAFVQHSRDVHVKLTVQLNQWLGSAHRIQERTFWKPKTFNINTTLICNSLNVSPTFCLQLNFP